MFSRNELLLYVQSMLETAGVMPHLACHNQLPTGHCVALVEGSERTLGTVTTRDAPDIRLAGYPAGQSCLFYIRYPDGYQIGQPDIRPDIR
jgi:hypothetical protein